VLFHQRLYGPLANSLFHHRPDVNFQPDSKLEKAVHKADDSIREPPPIFLDTNLG
jgi:hypothetical protein